MNIPENKNGVPDLLDEARWELEFELKMQVPVGEKLAGMAHHKVHDVKWTQLSTGPHEDPMPRYLQPPSTAATLNLAANAAQAARIWKSIDKPFSEKCLQAAPSGPGWPRRRTRRSSRRRGARGAVPTTTTSSATTSTGRRPSSTSRPGSPSTGTSSPSRSTSRR